LWRRRRRRRSRRHASLPVRRTVFAGWECGQRWRARSRRSVEGPEEVLVMRRVATGRIAGRTSSGIGAMAREMVQCERWCCPFEHRFGCTSELAQQSQSVARVQQVLEQEVMVLVLVEEIPNHC